jgi:hypothetical protein
MVLVTKKKKQPTIHEKRRHGRHHEHSRRYHNTYWPYLPLVLIVALGVALNSLWPTLQNAVLGYATDTTVNGLLLETNRQRAAHNAGHLALSSQLSAAAQAKANDMAERNYWSHRTPDGNEPWVFVVQAGYQYEVAGENLAYGFDSSGGTVTGWMNSPSHRANLVNGEYQDVGFGIANAENYQGKGPQTIVVAMYGKRLQSAPEPARVAARAEPRQPEAERSDPAPASAPSERADKPNTNATAQAAPAATAPQENTPAALEPETQQVARLQLLTTENAAWAMFAATLIAAVAAGIFILRHSIFWHRVLVKGERFAARHHFLDVILVTLAVAAFLLTRTAGTIH